MKFKIVMKNFVKTSISLFLGLTIILTPKLALSRVGLAEWEILTPGDNIISNSDGPFAEFGTCLRAGESDANNSKNSKEPADQVFVSKLIRWRYYQDYIIGQSESGFFIFNETTKKVQNFATEKLWQDALETANFGAPKSSWLTAQDGWNEAWFLPMIWNPCRQILAPKSDRQEAPSLPASAELIASCQQQLSPENLVQYRERTLGKLCDRIKPEELVDNPDREEIQQLCRAVRGER